MSDTSATALNPATKSFNNIKILGLGGSQRQPSFSLSALNIALGAAAEAGATTELLDINQLALPFFRPEQPPEAYPDPDYIRAFLAKFSVADGFLWSAPTYHGTPGAAFKNALDFLELLPRRPRLYLTGKVGGLIAVASGVNGGPNALTSLIYNARALRLLIAPGSMHVSPARRVFDSEGRLQDEKLTSQLVELGQEVVRLTIALKT